HAQRATTTFMLPAPRCATPLPYTTLFRSQGVPHHALPTQREGGKMETFNPFRFEGRVGRLQYFGYSVVWGLVVTVMAALLTAGEDRKSTRLNSSHVKISYAVFCFNKKNKH